MKDLEVMMQNVISSAFETVTTVEGGVEVLDVFMHLASREVSPVMRLAMKCEFTCTDDMYLICT
jgi:hypothetical protein